MTEVKSDVAKYIKLLSTFVLIIIVLDLIIPDTPVIQISLVPSYLNKSVLLLYQVLSINDILAPESTYKIIRFITNSFFLLWEFLSHYF